MIPEPFFSILFISFCAACLGGAMRMIRVLSGASKPKTNKHVKPYCANGVCVPSAHGCLTASDMDRIGQQKRGMLPEITRPIETEEGVKRGECINQEYEMYRNKRLFALRNAARDYTANRNQ